MKIAMMLRAPCLALACYSGSLGLAWAGEFDEIKARAQRSLVEGVGVISAPALIRRRALEPEMVVDAILATACDGPCTGVSRDEKGGGVAESSRVLLKVSEDGASVHFVDKTVSSAAHGAARSEKDAMSDSDILRLGHQYISDHLAEVLRLGPAEAMIPLRTLHLRRKVIDARTDKAGPTMILSNEVVFGRTVNGLLVAGAGSKIHLSFGNDGRLRNFFYDWPSYEGKAPALPCVSIERGMERLRLVLGVQAGMTSTSVGASPTQSASGFPMIVDGVGEIHNFQCGYYDRGFGGSASPEGRQIDTGCEYHVKVRGVPLHGAVPMAESGFSTSDWPDAEVVLEDMLKRR